LTIFEEKSIKIHHSRYDIQSKKLHIKRVSRKDKKVTEKWSSEVEIKCLKPSGVLKGYEATGEFLAQSIT
jgi:hypothetical protein